MTIPDSWNKTPYKCHLVAEIADGDVKLVVYKYWLKSKQRWVYMTEEKWLVEQEIEYLAKKSQ